MRKPWPLGLPAHDACCGQMRDAERLKDVAVGRSELHDFGTPCGLNIDVIRAGITGVLGI